MASDTQTRLQMRALIEHEFKRVFRQRGMMFMVFVLPLLIWGLITGMIYLSSDRPISYEGRTLYILDYDQGEGEVQLGILLENILTQLTQIEEQPLYGVQLALLSTNIPESSASNTIRDQGQSPCVLIPSNFTSVYLTYQNDSSSVPLVDLLYLPRDGNFMSVVQDQLYQILYQPPFTIVEFEKQTLVTMSFQATEEEQLADPASAWQISFFGLYIALFVPGPIISNYFAREREKHTLESVLVLPLTDFQILLGKYTAGALLILIFSTMNMVGVLLYNLITHNLDAFSEIILFEMTGWDALFLCATLFLTSLTALSLGISITSKIRDSKSVGTVYNFVIVIPYAIIALFFLITENPPTWIYILPWADGAAMIMKGMFPNTLITEKITSSWTLDVVLHGAILLVWGIMSMVLATLVTKTGVLFSLGGD